MVKTDFQSFYSAHVDRIYRFVLFRVGGVQAVAEDLTSEIFLKALEAYDRYDPGQSALAWIYTIARNTLSNHYRDTAKARADVDIMDFPIAADDFLDKILAAEDRARVHKALAALSPEQRQLIELKYLQGYKHQEIAALLNKSVSAVKVATHRAIKQFKDVCFKI